ncbi:hypothetical protein H632_c1051p0 [Helicosporidium sp. ATCC 50920]|nr:hypothetical protein H632_c1051p0 [Helicosporidium sp. ATCC 50920]|eukprot:KDD74824.1 hypothetical protein H632_c1051p0 [Helicosporidium sp. ATCC 50920]
MKKLLVKFYSTRIQKACSELGVPRKVQSAAIVFLQRLYIWHSAIEHDPQHMMLACLYLACKAEECYFSAAELARLAGAPPALILRHELTLLSAIRYDLVVYHPYRALTGLWEDWQVWLAAQEQGADSAAPDEQTRQRVKDAALAGADVLLLSDAPLLFSPGQIALAALRSGALRRGLKLDGFLQHVCGQAGEGGEKAGSANALAAVLKVLGEIDALGAQAAAPVEQEQATRADKVLKTCRAALSKKGGKTSVEEGKDVEAEGSEETKAEKAKRKRTESAGQ